MATLQAARAKTLGLPLASARSWGLNRAIFYAAAKRGFKAASGAPGPAKPPKTRAVVREFWLGIDKAYKVSVKGKTLFTIGGEIQTPEDFQRQVERRFGDTFRDAWREALEIVTAYPQDVLESPMTFYEQVYRPRRDELAKKWNERARERAG